MSNMRLMNVVQDDADPIATQNCTLVTLNPVKFSLGLIYSMQESMQPF